MSRITWHDAYPDHPDNRSGRLTLARSRDVEPLFGEPELDIRDVAPTRPSDVELMPAHKHNDGHWCDAGVCAIDPARRDYACWECQMVQMEADDRKQRPSYGRNR